MGRKRRKLLFLALLIALSSFMSHPEAAAAKKRLPKVTKVYFARANTGRLTLYKGQTYPLKTTVIPADASNKKVKYSLSKKKIISVNAKGRIKALQTGTVYLTAKSDSSKKKSKLKITVVEKKKYKKIKSIKPKKRLITLSEGESTLIGINIKPVKASNKNLQYQSLNPNIVSVNADGKIKALKPGTAKIIIQTFDESRKKATVTVTVNPKHISWPTIPTEINTEEYVEFEIEQKDGIITEIRPILSGNYSTNGQLKSISYEVFDSVSSQNAKCSGEAYFEKGRWEIRGVELSPKENLIKIKAETYTGITAEKRILLFYQRGEIDENPQEEDIHYEEEAAYVKNRLVIYFEENIQKERITEILAEMKATVIGSLNTIQMYQIALPVEYENISELEAYAQNLSELYPEIISAEPEWVFTEQKEIIYDDAWNQATWDITHPMDENWWAEAVNAPLAWDYAKNMTPLRIGVIDDGFDVSHEDLKICFSDEKRQKENSTERHGTHVAGIIGATADNKKGITGLAWMNFVYGYDWHPSQKQKWVTSVKIQDLYVEAIENGCKVINMSLGTSGSLKDNHKSFSKLRINSWGRSASVILGKLLEKGFDFVVVQSAGNGADDGIGVDAVNNGHFASITTENCYHSKKVKKEDILNRILIVGAAEQKENAYIQTIFSNAGNGVNIAAPGRYVYSTLPQNTYGKLSGTSMAAPIVSATASMVWAVNKDFSGQEVVEIVRNQTESIAYDNPDSANTAGDIPLVNAGMAVKEAIRRSFLDNYKIVLTWEKENLDLDSHLRGNDISGRDIHVFYGNDNYEDANLCEDAAGTKRIEIIKMKNLNTLSHIRYGVHDFTNSGCEEEDVRTESLSNAKAVVKIYKGDSLLKTYKVPENQKGTVWTVFGVDKAGNIIDINTMEYEKYSTEVLGKYDNAR